MKYKVNVLKPKEILKKHFFKKKQIEMKASLPLFRYSGLVFPSSTPVVTCKAFNWTMLMRKYENILNVIVATITGKTASN